MSASETHRERVRGRSVVRALERRLGLALQPALQREVVACARRLVRERAVTGMSQVVAKLITARDDDPVVHALRASASVGETHFFRDPRQLETLARKVDEVLVEPRRAAPGGRALRVWSAACATGEELYTLAILFHTRFPDLKLELAGSDMNPAALRVAREGTYERSAFRAVDPATLEPWVRPTKAGRYVVAAELRAMASFFEWNIVTGDPTALSMAARRFDVIVCRNVLIYIDPARIEAVLEKLASLARAPAVLALSLPEAHTGAHAPGFQRATSGIWVRPAQARGHDRPHGGGPGSSAPVGHSALPTAASIAPPRAPRARSAPKGSSNHASHGPRGAGHRAASAPAPVSPSVRAPKDLVDRVTAARREADAGRLDHAYALLEQIIRDAPDAAAAFYVIGLIEMARQRQAVAVEAFRKALYLDPGLVAAEISTGQALIALGDRTAAGTHLERASRRLARRADAELIAELGAPVSEARILIDSLLEMVR